MEDEDAAMRAAIAVPGALPLLAVYEKLGRMFEDARPELVEQIRRIILEAEANEVAAGKREIEDACRIAIAERESLLFAKSSDGLGIKLPPGARKAGKVSKHRKR